MMGNAVKLLATNILNSLLPTSPLTAEGISHKQLGIEQLLQATDGSQGTVCTIRLLAAVG